MKQKFFRINVLAGVIGGLCALPTQAADFYFGADDDVSVQINSAISLGASWRTEGASTRLIGAGNDGAVSDKNPSLDDGNLNYGKNDMFSQIIKGSHDIQVTKGNFGSFARIKYWSDQELKEGNVPHGNFLNEYEPNTPLSDEGFADNAKFEGITLLDAYVYGSFDVAEKPLDVRIGRQVLSWGESTFIQGGLNSSNPFDVSALRRAGSTLKEGIMPVGMAYANLGLSESLSVEAFYQYEWAKTEIDGCGTLFSADFIADNCAGLSIGGDAGLDDASSYGAGMFVTRGEDVDPKDGGQYGLAARFFSETLNNTEFGVYYMNIHSRLPMLMAQRSSQVGTAVGSAHPAPIQLNDTDPQYIVAFPEDLQFFGLSFATNAGGYAVSGEVSFKPDTPVQINGNHLLAPILAEVAVPTAIGSELVLERVLALQPGEAMEGWDEYDVTQVQVTALKFFDQILGASRLTFVGEVGAVFVDGLESSGLAYGRSPVFGFDHAGHDGFATDASWGYRASGTLNYANAFAGINLRPTLHLSHDVSGWSPGPGGQFNEGNKSVSLSVEASYLNAYSATLGYKMFTGGKYNVNDEKDFLSISLAATY